MTLPAHTPTKGLKFAVLAFLDLASKVRTSEQAAALARQYDESFQGESWWTGDEPARRCVQARTLLAPWQLAQRDAAKLPTADRSAELVAAGFRMPLGSVRSDGQPRFRGKAAREDKPAPRPSKPFQAELTGRCEPERKGFDTEWESQQWALRRLVALGDPGATVRVTSARSAHVEVWTYAEACRRQGTGAVGPAMHHTRTQVGKVWGKAQTTKVSFSRG